VWLLRSRRSFGHQDRPIWHISYFNVIFVIIWHFMSYDAYDIEICHKSYWSSLVSKWPSGPRQAHPFIGFWLNNCLKIKPMENCVTVHFYLSKWPQIKKVDLREKKIKIEFYFKIHLRQNSRSWISISQESHRALIYCMIVNFFRGNIPKY
jgi:hypothetical protein